MNLFTIISRKSSSLMQKSTIFALSSGYGKCGVAVIRVSGPSTKDALFKITDLHDLPAPRSAVLRYLKHPQTRDVIDKGLVLWFPGPRSFTGEDSCEFQVHGGVAVISSVMSALCVIPGVRPAEPGEFTRRAFYNGKLDLTKVEGLADLIHAETEAQRKQALLHAEGALSTLFKNWSDILIKSIAHLEAYIDFSEDQNIEDDVLETVNNNLSKLQIEIEKHLNDNRRGERLRHGIKTVIVGEPNVGKSSLLNLLCQRPAAIVTPIAGTTRDIVEINLNLSGYPFIIADTAGLRNKTKDIVETEGIARALKYAAEADLKIFLVDVTSFAKYKERFNNLCTLYDYLTETTKNLKIPYVINATRKCIEDNVIIVLNKRDLLSRSELLNLIQNESKCIAMSCTTEDGLHTVIARITESAKELCGEPSKELPTISQERHRFLIEECLKYLEEYVNMSSNTEVDMALLAQKLRLALRSVGKITGDVSTEEILDVIFKDFCIGK